LAKDLQLRQKLLEGNYLNVGAVRQEPWSGTEVATVPLDERRVKVRVRWRKGESSVTVFEFLDTAGKAFPRRG